MEKIESQIRIARRRMIMADLLSNLTRFLLIGMGIAALAVLLPKLTPISFLQTSEAADKWDLGWLIGAAAISITAALGMTWWKRANSLDAALEVDRRFGLRERLSSAVSIPEQDRDHLAARALISDAEQKAEQLEVKDEFALGFGWPSLLPMLPVLLALGLFFGLSNREAKNDDDSIEANLAAYRERLEESREEMLKQIDEQIEIAEEEELEEAEVFLRQLREELVKKEQTPPLSKEEALAEFNELKEKLDEQARKLGKPNELRRQFSRMKPSSKGPADDLNNSLRDGDTKEAKSDLEGLAEKVEKGELSEEEQQQLAEQLKQMEQDLRDAVAAHANREDELRQQIEQAKQQGDSEKAAELESKLQEHQQSQPQMDQMQELADSLGEASDQMQNAPPSSPNSPPSPGAMRASDALRKAAQQTGEMSKQQKQSDSLEKLSDQVGECKASLSQDPGDAKESSGGQNKSSEGQGSEPSEAAGSSPGQQGQQGSGQSNQSGEANQSGNQQGNGGSASQSSTPGQGNGAGNGRGARAEQEEGVEYEDERVQGNLQEGSSVTSDSQRDGTNDPGVARSRVVEQVKSNLETKSDPTVEQRLPRRQKDHAREYFKQFSKQSESKDKK